MNSALLYRPGSKWTFVTALSIAAVVHLSAVAFGSWHREPLAPSPDLDVPVTGDADPSPESTPVVEVDTTPEDTSQRNEPDFVETRRPPRHLAKNAPAATIQPPGRSGSVSYRNIKPNTLSAPCPEYPYEARMRHVTGSGIAVVTVNSSNGLVIDARMERSTGNAILDRSAVSAFKRWRFRTGTPSQVRIPVTFTLSGLTI